MKLTRDEEQELLFNKLSAFKNTQSLRHSDIWSGLVQNDIKITRPDLAKAVEDYKKQKELAISEFNKAVEEIDELAKDAIRFASKYMID